MARLILDSGALFAVERNDSRVLGWLKEAFNVGPPPVVPTAVIAEAWRGGGPRSARVARLLKGCYKEILTEDIAKQAGTLLAQHSGLPRLGGKSRVVDAIVVITASLHIDAIILTSDLPDITALTSGLPSLRAELV